MRLVSLHLCLKRSIAGNTTISGHPFRASKPQPTSGCMAPLRKPLPIHDEERGSTGCANEADSIATLRGLADTFLLRLSEVIDVGYLENLASQISKEDLRTLTTFPAQPHPIVHAAVAALQCTMLSISSQHIRKSILQLNPWSVLRLEILMNLEAIWTKMARRLNKLRRGTKRASISIVQARFLVQLVLSPVLDTEPMAASWTIRAILQGYQRVSAIAEALLAYVMLVVRYSLAFESRPTPSPPKITSSVSPRKLQKLKPQLTDLPVKPHTAISIEIRRIRRGLKFRGRFCFFQAAIVDNLPSKDASGQWSALFLDQKRTFLKWDHHMATVIHDHTTDEHHRVSLLTGSASCRRTASIPAQILRLIARHQLPPGAQHTIVVQAAHQTQLFDPSSHGRIQPRVTHTDEFIFSLKIAVIDVSAGVTNSSCCLRLVAIGKAQILDPMATVAELRRIVDGSLRRWMDKPVLRILYRGSVLSVFDEKLTYAVQLLPFAMICVGLNEQSPQRSSPSSKCLLRSMLDMHDEVSSALKAAWGRGESNNDKALHTTVAVSLYQMDQMFRIESSPRTSGLIDLFVNWSAFEKFQQLQDSSVLYAAHRDRPKRLKTLAALADYQIPEPEEHLRPPLTAEEQEQLALPRKPFRSEKEYLKPLFATLTVESHSTGRLRTPFIAEMLDVLQSSPPAQTIRMVVSNDMLVLHFVVVHEVRKDEILVHFQRDQTCPNDELCKLRDAYVWQVVRLHPKNAIRKLPHGENDAARSPRWLRDVFRFVIHPTLDFTASTQRHELSEFVFFRVHAALEAVEAIVEASFWSRSIDWWHHMRTCDLEELVFSKKYEALCHSHPPSLSIDSLKFSKFLRECELQPRFLSVGDAAFLFATHRTPGSHYEMIYGGFMKALAHIAVLVYGEQDTTDVEHNEIIRRLFFKWLIRAPSMREIWMELVDSWRLAEKKHFMKGAARRYCAATRIRSLWKRYVTRCRHMEALKRLKQERLAASKLQSIYKMRRERGNYLKLRTCTIRVQLFIKARRYLRHLRAQQVLYVERMRVRLVKWMRQRLRVLRVWKQLNENWLARRARIQEKRSRLVSSGVFQLDSRRFRIALYRRMESQDERVYDLEILDPHSSWWRSVRLTPKQLEELKTPDVSKNRPKYDRRLLDITRRLYLKRKRNEFRLYKNTLETSLGRLIFHGAVRLNALSPTDWCVVRALLRIHDMTVISYSPGTSTLVRWDFSATFVYRVLQVTHFNNLFLTQDESQKPEHVEDRTRMRCVVFDALVSPDTKLDVLRRLIEYLGLYGTTQPTYEMQPRVIAERELARQRTMVLECERQQQRELTLVTRVQANARRVLARRKLRQVALSSYVKHFDRDLASFVYTLLRCRRDYWLQYTSKPPSLGATDIADPKDEWILVEQLENGAKAFFNPLRGVFSRINDEDAARLIQSWFRRVMWIGIQRWDLRCVSNTLRFHHNTRPPTDLNDPNELEYIVRHAFDVHVLQHDFKTAYTMYESALAIAPNDVRLLVGLAIVLVHTCRYPVKQSWPRALALLEQARTIESNLVSSLEEMESRYFGWALLLRPQSLHAIGNYAVYLQCVSHEFDKAEILYRRALDLNPSNEWILENYRRLEQERTPTGVYHFSGGPGKIAVWRSQEVRRLPNSTWREMDDQETRCPAARRFFHDTRTGRCRWTEPNDAREEVS